MNLHIHLCVLTKQIPTSCILYAIDSRGVHRSGGSGLCPTCNWPVRDWVGRNPTRNRPVKRVRFRMSVCQQVASVSSEDETQRKTAKINKISLNLAKIWWGFHQIQWFFPQIVPKIAGSSVSMPDLIVLVVEICQIKLKTRWNRWRIR